MDGKICCFTGHRPGKLMITEGQVRERLESAVAQAVCDGFTTYLSGMAKGTDLVAAEIVLRLRESDPRLKLVCAMPFEGFGQHWPDGWTKRMRCVLENADSVHYVSKTYSPAVFQRRNRWLVDHSERVLAVFTGERGGTKNTLDYARRKGVECIIIDGK